MKVNKKALLLVTLLSSSLLLTSCDTSVPPLTAEDFLKKLFPNPWEALFTFCAFIVLLLVAFFFAYKPVKKILKARREYEKEKLEGAAKLEMEARAKVEAAESDIKEARKEAVLIIDKAKVDAQNEAQLIKEKAHKEIENEKKLASEDIAREIEASKDAIHNEIVNVAIEASSKVLGREVNKEDNEQLINNFVKDLEENK